jgi:hypothetical protein
VRRTDAHVRTDAGVRPCGHPMSVRTRCCVRADATVCADGPMPAWSRPHGRESVRTVACLSARSRPRGCAYVRTNVSPFARTHGCVRADASVLPPCNFIMDATVRLSHGRPSGHRPTVRPSVIVRVTTLLILSLRMPSIRNLGACYTVL